MARGPRSKVPFRRRREHKTNYRLRKNLLMSGLPRAVVRCSTRNVSVQFAKFDLKGDLILATATTQELVKMGWTHATGNLTSAYLAGYLAGTRAKKANIDKAVLDIGLRTPTKGSKVFAALKGMLDAGVEIPHNEVVFPSEERISGSHINDKVPKTFETVLAKVKEEGK